MELAHLTGDRQNVSLDFIWRGGGGALMWMMHLHLLVNQKRIAKGKN